MPIFRKRISLTHSLTRIDLGEERWVGGCKARWVMGNSSRREAVAQGGKWQLKFEKSNLRRQLKEARRQLEGRRNYCQPSLLVHIYVPLLYNHFGNFARKIYLLWRQCECELVANNMFVSEWPVADRISPAPGSGLVSSNGFSSGAGLGTGSSPPSPLHSNIKLWSTEDELHSAH